MRERRIFRVWLLALVGWAVVWCFYDLDGGSAFEPTDAWVAQRAREMRDSGDHIVPRLAGEPSLQKSPGPYYAVILTSWVRGTPIDVVSARIPSAVAGVIVLLSIVLLTRRIAGERAAVFAGLATISSIFLLYWSHRANAELGLTACATVALTSFWIASDSPPGRKRNALWLLGYFAAGSGMLYKLPMPLACVGIPAVLYVLIQRRWRLLASGWHLVGLVVFLLPWLPWVLAILWQEPAARLRWEVEFLDRFTGAAPNVEENQRWFFYFLYLLPPLLFTVPYTVSVPGAFLWAWRASRVRTRGGGRMDAAGPLPQVVDVKKGTREQGNEGTSGAPIFGPPPQAVVDPGVGSPGEIEAVNRDGARFLLIWFFGLFAFFTVAAGKEIRYFLPAMPPLFVMLGGDLALLFRPRRGDCSAGVKTHSSEDEHGLPPRRTGYKPVPQVRPAPQVNWLFILACVLLPLGSVGVAFALREWTEDAAYIRWSAVLWPYCFAAAFLSAGGIAAAWLYTHRREYAAYGALIVGMWGMWAITWSRLMPILVSQAPVLDFARQLQERLPIEYRQHLRNVGFHDPRIIWFTDIRYPRVVDPLELLAAQEGDRTVEFERRYIGARMIEMLEAPEPVLFVARRPDYVTFELGAREALEKSGRSMPPTHLWLQSRFGSPHERVVLFGNQPPPWPAPELAPPSQRLGERQNVK